MVARARVQAGNLAHSLRTPLAVMMDEADRLAEIEGVKENAAVLHTQAAVMQQQIDYQLARARSVAGTRIAGQKAQLPELIVPILSAMRRLHPQIEFLLERERADGTRVHVDPVDLSELLSILLDNVGKFARETVRVSCRHNARGGMTIIVSDDGPGMGQNQIAKAFEIGSRFDLTKLGSGLGLAIGRDIAEAAGIELQLRKTAVGFDAVLEIPPALVQ